MTATLRATSTSRPTPSLLVAALAASLAVAGILHCLLMPDHFVKSTIFGLGFLGAGIAQLGLAGAVLLRPGRLVYAAIIAISLTLMSLYAFNVAVGLPFHGSGDHTEVAAGGHGEDVSHGDEAAVDDEAGHGESGLVLGAGEPVDVLGAGTQAAQLAAIAFAGLLLRRSPSPPGAVSA
ncbi:MAG: hypothetical protein ACR2I5_10645 [Candidatus Limnocylindria bacterium]